MLDFTASGLTHVNEKYAKVDYPSRVDGPFVDLNFGLVEVDWGTRPPPEVTLSAIGVDGAVALERRFSLAVSRAPAGA